MRLFFASMLFCSLAFCENWIADSDISRSNAQEPDVPGYISEALCLSANPGHICYEYTGQDLRYRKIVGGVWVDDAALKAAFDAEQTAINASYSPTHAMARVSGGGGADCTTSPCVIDRVHPNPEPISSVSRSGVGQYLVLFSSGAFSLPPVCNVTSDKGSSDYCVLTGLPTTTSFEVHCFSSVGVPQDARFSVVCGGKK